jgi:hypothetical protein
MIDISIKSNVAAIQKKLGAFANQQLAFVEARTVTELAKIAQAEEKHAMPEIFDRPTPFTVNSVAVQGARKGLPIAKVFIRDIAAKYLIPFEHGGEHYMAPNQASLIMPVGAKVNKFGNLPRNFLRQNKKKAGMFQGLAKVKGKEINGLWQRTPNHGLKLLVSFEKNRAVKPTLKFGDRAKAAVLANVNRVFGEEMAKALARARLK